jgi:Protein of unknown function (DUF2827)
MSKARPPKAAATPAHAPVPTPHEKKPRDMNALRVGITLFLKEESQSIWENGIFQNLHFLAALLEKSKRIEKVFLVNGGTGDPAKGSDILAGTSLPVISMAEAMDTLDVVIELSAQLNPDWGHEFAAKGGKIIGMRVANDFILDAERMAFDLPPAMLMSKVPYHKIWTLPAFEKTCASYYQYGFDAPVEVMQHLWAPGLIVQAATSQGISFEYKPGRKRWRLAVLEPNLSTVKTCHVPMMVCDAAYRRAPMQIEHAYVFNALALKEHGAFVTFARCLDMVRDGIGSFEGRLPLFQIMTQLADGIVSHHWENAQNYLYYEALHGGFPLIHNSDMLDGCGYYYPSFDPEQGGLALLQAIAEHDLNLGSYKADAQKFLWKLNPTNPANVQAYEASILELFA